MKKMLDCFDYIKRYQVDILESLHIFLEFCLLKKLNLHTILLQKAQKRKKIYDECIDLMQQHIVTFIPPNPNLNLAKILKILDESKFDAHNFAIFFDAITQKKTQNKLYFYTMPIEVQELILSLISLKKTESLYHPCYGIGSLFVQVGKEVEIYGEELDERFCTIAKLLCSLLGLDSQNLLCNDILKQPSFKDSQGFLKFDAMICNPPLHSHMGTHYIKEDERFLGVLSKSYPELIFLSHALVHFGGRGVFILRSQILKNPALESKLESFLQGRLECIIELPKNIFPYQNHDFSLIVLKDDAKEILYINASDFFTKEGRYNRLGNLEDILSLYHQKSSTDYSRVAKSLEEIFGNEQREQDSQRLGEVVKLVRGQRVYGSNKDEEIEFFEVGVSDFAPLGFTHNFLNLKTQGNKEKIHKYSLKPFDILLALRGNVPKMTILPSLIPQFCIANVGILVLRAKNEEIAKGLYGYLFSNEGERALRGVCDGVLDLYKLVQMPLPKNLNQYVGVIDEIEALALKLGGVMDEISTLKEKICKS